MTQKTAKARANGQNFSMATQSPQADIGVSPENRAAISAILNTLLADEHILYVKTRKYHWNVVGPDFHSLHVFFELQYEEIAKIIDEVAERVRQLGCAATGSMSEFLDSTRLAEQPGDNPEALQMIANLLADHESIIRSVREAVDACDEEYSDMGTSDFLTAIMQQHEKMAWMLRAHHERPLVGGVV